MDKYRARMRRATKTRRKIRELEMPRLSVYRSARHIYVQLIDDVTGRVIVAASTVESAVKSACTSIYTGSIAAAKEVGKVVAERAKAAGIEKVAFDRSGYKYHGRVAALADAARENGLLF